MCPSLVLLLLLLLLVLLLLLIGFTKEVQHLRQHVGTDGAVRQRPRGVGVGQNAAARRGKKENWSGNALLLIEIWSAVVLLKTDSFVELAMVVAY